MHNLKELLQNIKTNSENKYTNKELRFVMIKSSEFYVTPNDLSSINNTTVQLQFIQYIDFRQQQDDVIIITLLPDLFVQEQSPSLNSQKKKKKKKYQKLY